MNTIMNINTKEKNRSVVKVDNLNIIFKFKSQKANLTFVKAYAI